MLGFLFKLSKRMSSPQIKVNVRTLRGARIKDEENILIEAIDNRDLQNLDMLAFQVGTNNVSDRDGK